MATPLASPRRPATLHDLDELPEHVIGHIVDGELIVLPRPEAPHVRAAGILYALLFQSFWYGLSDPGGWVLLPEPKILFGEQMLVPDLAGWRQERYVEPQKGPYTVAPAWICEILSPSTASFDRSTKLPIYAHAGVGHTWLIDPSLRTLEVLRLREGKWQIESVFRNEDKVRAEPFEAFELDLALLWRRVPANPEVAGNEEDGGAQLP
jgi:Uma2 family endonuclease